MRSKKRLITVPRKFAPLFAIRSHMQNREEENKCEDLEEEWVREKIGGMAWSPHSL